MILEGFFDSVPKADHPLPHADTGISPKSPHRDASHLLRRESVNRQAFCPSKGLMLIVLVRRIQLARPLNEKAFQDVDDLGRFFVRRVSPQKSTPVDRWI